jgi:5-methylcytosine-specific restriction protein A
MHQRRERARHLVEKRKALALSKHGKLECEVCGFNFATVYGDRGTGFIECHHTKPVETLGDGTRTRLQDLALVCSNCHRMIHAKRLWLTIAELKLYILTG